MTCYIVGCIFYIGCLTRSKRHSRPSTIMIPFGPTIVLRATLLFLVQQPKKNRQGASRLYKSITTKEKAISSVLCWQSCYCRSNSNTHSARFPFQPRDIQYKEEEEEKKILAFPGRAENKRRKTDLRPSTR
jgi:hypothetical protein